MTQMDQLNKAGCSSNICKENKNVFPDSSDEEEMLFSLRKFRVRPRYAADTETSNTDAKGRRKTRAEGPNAREEQNTSLFPRKRKADNLKRNCKSMKPDEAEERVERKPPSRGERTNQSCSKAGEMLEIEGREVNGELCASNCWLDSENEMRTTGKLRGGKVTKPGNACQKRRERKAREDLSETTDDEIESKSTSTAKKRSCTTASNSTTLGRKTRLHQPNRRPGSSEHVSLHPTEFLDNFRPSRDAATVIGAIPIIISSDESGNSESNGVASSLMPQRSRSSSSTSLIANANVETIDTQVYKNNRSVKTTKRKTSRSKNNTARKKQHPNKKRKDDVYTLNYSSDDTIVSMPVFRSLHRARASEKPEDVSKQLTKSSYRNTTPPLSPTMFFSSASTRNISTSILDEVHVETANFGRATQSSILYDSSESDFETDTRMPVSGSPFNSALYRRHQSIIRNRRNMLSLHRDGARRVEQRPNFMLGWETSADNPTPMSNSSTPDTEQVVTPVPKTRRTARMSTCRTVSDQQTSSVLRQIQADEEFARILQAELDGQGASNSSTASTNVDFTRTDQADWTGRTAAERSADILRRIYQMTDYEWSVHRAIHHGLDDPPVPPEYVNSPCTIEADILEYLEEERSQGRPFIRESSRQSNEAESTGAASTDVPASSNARPQRLAQTMRRHFEDIRHLRRTIDDLRQTMQVLESDITHRRRHHLPATRLEDFPGLWLNNPGESSFNYEQLLDLVDRLGVVHPRGLDQQSIKKIPTTLFSLSKVKEGEDVPLCTICWDAYEEGGVLRVLKCSHNFHKPCIDKWLAECRTCPICRVHVEP